MKDWRITQQHQIETLLSKGWRVVASGISLDEAALKSKRKSWPIGSIFFWASGTMIAPPAQQQEEAA